MHKKDAPLRVDISSGRASRPQKEWRKKALEIAGERGLLQSSSKKVKSTSNSSWFEQAENQGKIDEAEKREAKKRKQEKKEKKKEQKKEKKRKKKQDKKEKKKEKKAKKNGPAVISDTERADVASSVEIN